MTTEAASPEWIMFLRAFAPIIGVVVGWMLVILTRHLEQIWFGAKLKIDCQRAPGKTDETPAAKFVKFRVQNSTQRHVAKNCRAYLVELHKVSNSKIVSGNLISDTFQLPWAGPSFDPRDLPAKIALYVDLVHFSKHQSGWGFHTNPGFYASLATLADHRGTYRFTVVVAGDDAIPQTRHIYVDYNGDWKSATPYD